MTHLGPKAIGLILLIIIIGLVVFVANTGIFDKIKDLKLSTPSFFSPSSTAFNFKLGGAPNIPANYGSVALPPPSPAARPQPASPPSSSASGSVNPADIPQGFTEADLSYYFHKVRIGWVSPSASPNGTYFSLSNNSSYIDPINISGWLLRAQNGGGQYIPKAINVYDPSGFATDGSITLRNGDFATFYPSQSPVGKNLRMNRCIGYLQETINFNPGLPQDCPSADRREISSFSGACQDYILSLGSCRTPSDNPPVPYYDYRCFDYLDGISYKGCFDKHSGEGDFLGREWRAWIGPSQFMDTRHDRLDLFDKDGKLVDEYTY